MNFHDFWYIVDESKNLCATTVLSRRILDEWVVVFRDETGAAVAMRDRCIHRSAQLSLGTVKKGKLKCPYHGWVYDGEGKVVSIPSLGDNSRKIGNRCAPRFEACERDGYVYVRLNSKNEPDRKPFAMPRYGEAGWKTIRLTNRIANNVTNCAENFVDIPHTAFVHEGIFRSSKSEPLSATVHRTEGNVLVSYKGESKNLGIFDWFLNPKGDAVEHHDNFYMPNITSVSYVIGAKHFIITSQSVPASDDETIVYTDLTYNYGIWNYLAAPIIRRYGQKIIDQDIDILANQMETIKKYGDDFSNSPADVIHVLIESVRNALAEGKDPRELPDKKQTIAFWV